MRTSIVLWACLLIVGSLQISAAAKSPVPSVAPGYTQPPIVLDGKLNDAAWQKAPMVELNHYTTGKPAKARTTVALLFDDKYLYLGYKCYEPMMDKLVAENSTENSPVYMDDCLEIMIAPHEVALPDQYYHFAANSLGTKFTALNGLGAPVGDIKWTVKTSKDKDAWYAEVAIPLSVLKDSDSNDAFWRINLFRERYTDPEYTSWALCNGTFHSPFNFGKLMGINLNGQFIGLKEVIKPTVNKTVDRIMTRNMERAVDPADEKVVIIPKPVKMTLLATDFPISTTTRIIVADNASKGNLQAAKEINEELKDEYNLELPIVAISQAKDYANTIILGQPGNPIVDALLKELNTVVTNTTPGAEGYVLKMTKQSILIAGSDEAGTYYGVQSLKQLFRKSPQGQIVAKGADIWDKPAFKFRSAHIIIDIDSPIVHTKMISKIFARYKVNNLIMEAEQGIAWKSCPEIKPKYAMTIEQAKELVKFANDHFITVTPLIQSLGHGEWMFRYNKNLEFCEYTTFPYAYCPLNPKSYEFILPIMEEAIDIFNHPEYLHIGHDEFQNFGKFPIHKDCIAVGAEKLYYMDTIKIYEFLKSRGVKTMMWGDILLKEPYKEIVKTVPRDIVIADWHYDGAKTQPSVDFFQDLGFKVLGCTFYDLNNMSNFSEYAYEKKSLGMMQTTWAGYDQNSSIIQREPQQVSAYIISADYAWNPVNRNINSLGYNSMKVLKKLWGFADANKPLKKGFSVNLSPFTNINLSYSAKSGGFLGYKNGNDLNKLVAESKNQTIRLLDDVNYRLSLHNGQPGGIVLQGNGITSTFPAQIKSIPVERYVDELYFLHTSLFGAPTGTRVGEYVVNYQDGSKVTIPLVYVESINGWKDITSYYYTQVGWQAVNDNNDALYLTPLAWKNLFPAKKIQSIDFVSSPEYTSPLLLAITGTYKS